MTSPVVTLTQAIERLESEPRTPRREAEIALLREAANYASDWVHGNAGNRGPLPETVYRKELALARAVLGESENPK